MGTGQIDFSSALAAIREHGLMLETDRAFPSLVALMAGAPVKGTWWAHPLANDIYMMGQRLMDHRDVMFIRLVERKFTYVHRKLWPQVYAVATAREPWQLAELPPSARSMLKMVEHRESLRMDEIRSSGSAKELGTDARMLESRLLVFGDDVHTDSGAHVKRIATWQHWAKGVGFSATKLPSVDDARTELERTVSQLNERYGAQAKLPWQMHARSRPARFMSRLRA